MTTLAEIEQAINDLGYGTEEYHEALAMYFLTLARSQWRLADQASRRRLRKEALERAKVVAG